MEKLSSASFFKLTHNEVNHMKENGATDVVKKWFEYLKLKPKKNAKAAQADDIHKESLPDEETEIQEFYDMEELMEHRIITEDDDVEVKYKIENDNSLAKYHVENMSVLQSKYILKECEKAIEIFAIEDNDSLKLVYAKERNLANVREKQSLERKRMAILSEIFHCLNEKLVKIPDVANELELSRTIPIMDLKNIVDQTFPFVSQRYAAYLAVAKRAKQLMQEIIRELEREMIEKAKILSQLKRQHEVQILKNADVVGMTTTGAAKFNDLLIKMKSRIGNFLHYSQLFLLSDFIHVFCSYCRRSS